jgi:DNA-binding SARP family transcriptional activator/streptogramin lyase
MIEVSVLGPLEVRRGGELVPVPGRKPRALLLALVLRANEPVSQDRLIEALWGDKPPPRAGPNLHVHVATLRKLLNGDPETAIETSGGGYRLRIDAGRIDARRFERLVAEARGRDDAADRLRRALALWRGPALAEVADEPFAHTEARRLEESRLAALEERIDADLVLGRHRELVPELESLVAAHPLRERLAGQLMQALYAAGRQADALTVYRNLRRRLVDELGIEPSRELQALERAILKQDAALAIPHAAPAARRHRRRVWGIAAVALVLVVAGGIAAAVIVPGGRSEVRPAPAVVANSLVRLDPKSGRIVSVTRVGDTPVSLALTRDAVWVVNRGDRTVSRVDLRTKNVRTIGGVPFAWDIVADGRGNVWVSGAQTALVARISAGTATFPEPPRPPEIIHVPVHAGALAVGAGYLWVANAGVIMRKTADSFSVGGSPSVSRIDLRSRRLVTPIRTAWLPLALAFGAGGAWIGGSDPRYEHSYVSVLRTGSSAPQTISVVPFGPPLSVAVGAGGVWVLGFNGSLRRFNPETRRLAARISLERLSTIEPLSVAVGAGYVWVTNRSDFSISKIDPATNRIVRTVRLGHVGVVPCGVAATTDAVWVTIGPDTDCGAGGTTR